MRRTKSVFGNSARSRGATPPVLSFAFVLALIISAPLAAQQWQLAVSVPNHYPSPYTSDWQNVPGIANMIITYTGRQSATVRLEARIVSVEHGQLASGNSNGIAFSGPGTVAKDNRDFWSFGNIHYDPAYKAQVIQTGRLPEGTYDLYVTLVRVGTNESLAGGKDRFYILSFNRPSLIAPPDHDTVQVAFPAFSWTPATTHPGFTTRYSFRVCEMLVNQSPEVAINNVPAYSTTVVNATNAIYPNSAQALEVGKRYVWQVQARDRDNVPIGEDQGKSEVWEFQYKTAGAPPSPPPPPPPPHPSPSGGVRIDSLLLQAGVAYIKDFTGQMTPDGNDYKLNGTATMRLISLAGNEATGCTVTNLIITLNSASPFNSTIKSGTVGQTAQNGTLFGYHDNFLGVTRVGYTAGQADPVTIDALVTLPKISVILTANSLPLSTSGVKPTTVTAAQEFTKWGTTFSISAMAVSDSSDASVAQLSGNLKLKIVQTEMNVGSFAGFRFSSKGDISGSFPISDFALIPSTQYLRLTKCSFTVHSNADCLEFDGLCGGLPSPMDKITPNDQSFSFLLDMNGNVVVNAALINEFATRGQGNDASEFTIPAVGITLDLIYLAVTWNTGPGGSCCPGISMALDIYFPTTTGSTRLGIGSLVNNQLVNGIMIDNTGKLNWPSIDASPLYNSPLLLGDLLEIPVTALSLVTNSPLKIQFTGPLSLNVPGVTGSVQIDDASIDLEGNVTFPNDLHDAQFTVIDVVSVGVANISWSSQPSQVTFKKDCTTGSNEKRSFSSAETTVNASSYFQMTGVQLNVGQNGAIGQGSIQKFLVFESGNTRRIVMNGAELNAYQMKLDADFDYTSDVVRCAGQLTLPTGNQFVAVGKFGKVNGQTSVGIFAAGQNLHIPILPGVFLDGAGGGFFYNPEPEDIRTVQLQCNLNSDLSSAIVAPPGAFALFLYGAVSVIDADLIYGKALVMLSSNRMDLNADAEVVRAAHIVEAQCYLAVQWNPKVFAEGSMKINTLNVADLISGDGSGDFYVYSTSVWGVEAAVNLNLYVCTEGGDFFVGSPGLMASAHFGYDMNLYIISGSLDMDAMVWYATANSAFGAYASIDASGDLLGGLVGADFGLEGALIHEPSYTVIYAVGTLDIEVCWVDVFSGSVWVSVGTNGFDGGTGSNSTYDQAIQDAKNMAAQMEAQKEQTEQQIAQAKADLYALSDAQRQKAGLQLVEPHGWDDYMHNRALYQPEFDAWAPETLDWYMKTMQGDIFNGTAEALAATRQSLQAQANAITAALTQDDAAQQAVNTRLAAYQPLITEQLPTVRSLSAHGTPFLGFQTKTAKVPDSNGHLQTVTVRTGFGLDAAKSAQQQNDMTNIKSDNDAYIAELTHITWVLDCKLDSLDSLLFVPSQSLNCLAQLCSLYRGSYDQIVNYYWQTARYLDQEGSNAYGLLLGYNNREYQWENAVGCSSIVWNELHYEMYPGSMYHPVDYNRLYSWLQVRQSILQQLLGDPNYGNPLPDPSDQNGIWQRWMLWGMELWYDIPKTGYTLVVDSEAVRADTVKTSYFATTGNFGPGWESFTGSMDAVYDQKANLYELLYDLADQLERLSSQVDTTTWHFIFPIGGDSTGSSGGSHGEKRLVPGGHIPMHFFGGDTTGSSGGSHGEEHLMTGGHMSMHFFGGDTTGSSGGSHYLFKSMFGGDSSGLVVWHGFFGNQGNYHYVRWHNATPCPGLGYFGYGDHWYPMIPHNYETRRSTADLARLLTVPTITSFQGNYYSNDSTPVDWGRLDLSYAAIHPVGVPDYSLCRRAYQTSGTSSTMGDDYYRSAGTKQSFWYPFIQGWLAPGPGNPYGTYDVWLRARGAGGYAAWRKATVNVEYKQRQGETGWQPYSANLMSSDNTPPASPIIFIDTIITSLSQLRASWISWDNESGIQEYRYSVGGWKLPEHSVKWQYDTLLPWTSAGGQTDMNIRGLHLWQGGHFVLFVQAVNGAGLLSPLAAKDFRTDNTPPVKPRIRIVIGGCYEGDQRFVFQWDPAQDPETGILSYRYAIGSSPGGSDIASAATTAGTGEFSTTWVTGVTGLKSGEACYLTLTAVNGVGLQSSDTSHCVIQFTDNTPPSPGCVVNVYYGGYPQQFALLSRSNATDDESGISKYKFRVLKKNSGNVEIGWTDMPDNVRYLYPQDLPQTGSRHWFCVKAINGVGLETSSRTEFLW